MSLLVRYLVRTMTFQRSLDREDTLCLCTGVAASQIGVIALYKAQANLLRSEIDEQCGVSDGAVLVSTVDAFQGGERDIIIISCARTSTVGFTDNAERLNVALTRARHHLIIIGNAMTLQASKTWAAVIQHKDMCRGTIDCLHEHLQNNRSTTMQAESNNDEQSTPEEDEADMEAWVAEVATTDKQLQDALSADPTETTKLRSSEREAEPSSSFMDGLPVEISRVQVEMPEQPVQQDTQGNPATEQVGVNQQNDGGYQDSLWG